jgi:hypothetical protein
VLPRHTVKSAVSFLPVSFSADHADAVSRIRNFFCANSLTAASAREKSKIDAGATSPFKLAVEVSIAM